MNINNSATRVVVAVAGDKTWLERLQDLILPMGYEVKKTALADGDSPPPNTAILIYARALPLQKTAQAISTLRKGLGHRALPILCVHPEIERLQTTALLDAGADDVLGKPFNDRLFQARLNALLRRSLWSGGLANDMAPVLSFANIDLNMISRQASAGGTPLVLSRLEFDLLAYFLRRPGAVQNRKDILSSVWGYPDEVQTRTLDKYVESLRRKLGPLGSHIQTVHGVGYCLSAATQGATNSSARK